MRPNDLELLRLIEGTMLELGQEVPSAYSKAQAQFCFMLLEDLANRWNEAAHHLFHDIRELEEILGQARDLLKRLPQDDPQVSSLLQTLEVALQGGVGEDLRLSALEERHRRLLGALERLLCLCEDKVNEPAYEALMPVRSRAYQHLRREAARGWTFWDILSFRNYIMKVKQSLPQES